MDSIWLPIGAVSAAVVMVFGVFTMFRMFDSMDDAAKSTIVFLFYVARAFAIGYLVYFSGRLIFLGEI